MKRNGLVVVTLPRTKIDFNQVVIKDKMGRERPVRGHLPEQDTYFAGDVRTLLKKHPSAYIRVEAPLTSLWPPLEGPLLIGTAEWSEYVERQLEGLINAQLRKLGGMPKGSKWVLMRTRSSNSTRPKQPRSAVRKVRPILLKVPKWKPLERPRLVKAVPLKRAS